MKIQGKQVNEWVQRAYENAVKHGWHEEEKSTEHWLMMIITEVSEAVQADRKGLYMDDLDKEGLKTVFANDHQGGLVEKFYEENIEGKVESEIADICIRLFDFMGVKGFDSFSDLFVEESGFTEMTFTEAAYCITERIIDVVNNMKDKETYLSSIYYVLMGVLEWAESLDIDIVQHINLKMRYNESREYHHGNKKY